MTNLEIGKKNGGKATIMKKVNIPEALDRMIDKMLDKNDYYDEDESYQFVEELFKHNQFNILRPIQQIKLAFLSTNMKLIITALTNFQYTHLKIITDFIISRKRSFSRYANDLAKHIPNLYYHVLFTGFFEEKWKLPKKIKPILGDHYYDILNLNKYKDDLPDKSKFVEPYTFNILYLVSERKDRRIVYHSEKYISFDLDYSIQRKKAKDLLKNLGIDNYDLHRYDVLANGTRLQFRT